MSHTYVSALFHCVFSTKQRRRLISGVLSERLHPYMGGVARDNKMKILEIGGTENHVHFLLSVPATLSLAKAVQLIKGGSSKWVHDTFPQEHGGFEWQEGYGAFSVGISQTTRTREYIRRQMEHHKTRSFEDEFRAFLKKHWIKYDEEYVFG